MHQESMQALEQLRMAQHAVDQRERMSNEVLRPVDMGAANRDRLVAAQEAAGIPYTNVTHNVTNNYNSTHNTMNQQDVHNQAMAMLQHHSVQFGTYMQQHRLNNERMLHLLMEHIRTHTGTPQQLNITMLSGGPPQPPGWRRRSHHG